MSFEQPHLKSASIESVILTPSGEMTEIFEDGDIVNRKDRERRLEIFFISERHGRGGCTSVRYQLHYCHHMKDEMGECRQETWLFGCDQTFTETRHFGADISRMVSRISNFGKVHAYQILTISCMT